MSSIYRRIYAAVRRIPAGRVATYGDIARQVGTSARVVGNALHVNPDAPRTPCHRVVNARGRLAMHFGAPGGINEQRLRLTAEGVVAVNDYVDLTRLRFPFNE